MHLLPVLSVIGALAAPPAPAVRPPTAPVEVVVLPPTTREVALFPGERARLHGAVQAWVQDHAAALGVRPLPLAEALRAAELAAEGRFRSGGPVCAWPPRVEDVAAALRPKAGLVRTAAEWTCRGDGKPRPAARGYADLGEDPTSCARVFKLRVSVSLPDPAGGPSRRTDRTAVVDRAADPAAWAAALAALEPDESRLMGVLAAIAPAPAGVLVDVEDAVVAGDWGPLRSFRRMSDPFGGGAADALVGGVSGGGPVRAPAPAPRDLRSYVDEARAALDRCHVAGAVFRDELAVAVGADGVVTRCVISPPEGRRPPPDYEECVCRALRGVRFPAGAADRRLALGIRNRADTPERLAERPVYAWFQDVTATDESLLPGGLVDEEPVERCLVAHPPAEAARKAEAPAELTVGPDGRVSAVTLTWPDALPAAARGCVEEALRSLAFPCPREGGPATVRATLGVSLKD